MDTVSKKAVEPSDLAQLEETLADLKKVSFLTKEETFKVSDLLRDKQEETLSVAEGPMPKDRESGRNRIVECELVVKDCISLIKEVKTELSNFSIVLGRR